MATIFTKIVKGEIPCYKLAEDDNFLAFLDINPLAKGHALVIPKNEVDYIFDIESPLYNDLWAFAKKVALAVKQVMPCEKIGIAVIGLEVAHAHIHLVPINKVSDLDFSRPKLNLEAAELAQIASRISAAIK
ncbi:MAG: HIT family protein [Bacteroidota bacterium]